MSYTISENYGTYQGDTSYILDGNSSNCWRGNDRNTAGKYVLITSSENIFVSTVTYTTTQSSEIFSTGTWLQYSLDGNTFTDIEQFNGSSTQTFTINANCRYIRIYCKSGSGYISISELTIVTGSGGGNTPSGGESKTADYYPASLDSDHSYASISAPDNALDSSSSTSYTTVYLTTGSRATTVLSYSFDLSDIPENAIIKEVTCTAKVYTNGTNSNRVASRKIQLYSGSTAKGSPATVYASTTTFSITCGEWTREELRNAKIRLEFVRGTSYTSTNYYIRFYGATLQVKYEIPAESATTVWIKNSGAWVAVDKVYQKQNGTWVAVETIDTDLTYEI